MIVVFGSINVDLMTRVARLPRAGETVLGRDYQTFPGGKGANQALAAARAGGEVALVGAVGRDQYGDPALSSLREAGVDLRGVRVLDARTGVAMIAVDEAGENQIVVASGANAHVDHAWLDGRLGSADTLVLQQEIPAAAIEGAIAMAKACGARVILNAAPFAPLPERCTPWLDALIVNEHEATGLARGLALPTEPAPFASAFSALHGAIAIVTLGERGALGCCGSKRITIEPPRVVVQDTTAAGDTFVGAFAAAYSRGDDWEKSLRYAVVAGSLATTCVGAQPSIPTHAQIQRLIDQRNNQNPHSPDPKRKQHAY
jgi:ribokinase